MLDRAGGEETNDQTWGRDRIVQWNLKWFYRTQIAQRVIVGSAIVSMCNKRTCINALKSATPPIADPASGAPAGAGRHERCRLPKAG